MEIDREARRRARRVAVGDRERARNAYNQQQVSTIYTADERVLGRDGDRAEYQLDIASLGKFYVRGHERPGAAQPTSPHSRAYVGPSASPIGADGVGHDLVQPRAERVARARSTGEQGGRQMLPATITAASPGRRRHSASQQGLLHAAGRYVFVIYIILGILYESFIHPITILTGLPFAAFGALVTLYRHAHRAGRVRLRRDHHADRHREEERDHDDRLRDREGARGAHDAGASDHARRRACVSGRS